MSKKFRNINLCLCAVIILATISILQVRLLAKAYSGIATLTERQLYKETNTYDVDTNFFNIDGSFRPTTDNSRIMNTTQYNINYDMSTKQRIPIMEYAQITVLTHGLDSDARVRSNNFSASNKAIGFAYDNSSLITKISDQVGGANIYWAKMTGYNIFDLYNITNQKGAYSSTKQYKVENIVDISKHIIIIFESNWYNNSIGNYVSLESNNNVYYQFNYMLSKIIYDVKVANGGILPKVNLIGHSRGGITNLQYALESRFSVDTG